MDAPTPTHTPESAHVAANREITTLVKLELDPHDDPSMVCERGRERERECVYLVRHEVKVLVI
jgi:hypothetical protein